jgi:hypothetical protein
MPSTAVRVPDETYERLRETAIDLDVPISEAAQIVLESGFDHVNYQEHLELDPDLAQKQAQELVDCSSEPEGREIVQEYQERQRERNRGRSDLAPDPS